MRLRWRLGLVAVIAAAVVGGFMPHGVLSATGRTTTEMVQIAESPVSVPLNCVDATCGKGSPAPPVPAPAVALAAALAAIAVVAAAAGTVRRHRGQAAVLPAESRDPLFHPPQFS
jgi:hypothetical protein